MEISLRLTKSLAVLNNGRKDAVLSLEDGCSMAGLIELLNKDMSGIEAALLNGNCEIADSINIYVNGENIRYLQGINTLLYNRDHIAIIPAAAAG